MPPLIDRLRKRASETAERAAAGSAVPAGTEPQAPEKEHRPRVRERGSMRRRLRELRQKREAMLAELGAIVLEMSKQERDASEVVERKIAELRSVDDEARALDAALDDGMKLDEVLSEGISGACANCGSLMGTDDNFCSRCGTAATASASSAEASPGGGRQGDSPPATQSTEDGEKEDEPGGNGKTPADGGPEETEGDPDKEGNGQAVKPEDS